MRKTIAAVTAGLLLVAGQAAAAGSTSVETRVGDRVGATSGESSEFMYGIPLSLFVAAGILVLVAGVYVLNDDSESD